MLILLQLFCGWLYGHFFEYAAHRWLFHNKKLKSFFRYHYSQHHARARKGVMLDPLEKNVLEDFEAKALVFILLLHLPLIFVLPYFYAMLVYSALMYLIIHRLTHRDDEFARKLYPWHYDHHMGTDQNSNWGVRSQMFDKLLGTRVVYAGTKKEIIKYRNYKVFGKYALRSRSNKR